MMAVIVIVLAVYLSQVNGVGQKSQKQRQFNSNVVNADRTYTIFSENNTSITVSGNANAGATALVGDITDLKSQNKQFGVGFGQFASKNTANVTRGKGEATSGNKLVIEDVSNSSLATDQFAQSNIASSDKGDAISGNFLSVEDITGSKLDFSAVARYNVAITEDGYANPGNIATIQKISNSVTNQNQQSFANFVQASSGPANAGNVLRIGSIRGRKLQKLQQIY